MRTAASRGPRLESSSAGSSQPVGRIQASAPIQIELSVAGERVEGGGG